MGRYHFVRGDIADPGTVLEALVENCDAIINFAAEFLRTNIIGT